MMHDSTIYELQIFIVSNKVTEGSADRIRFNYPMDTNLSLSATVIH